MQVHALLQGFSIDSYFRNVVKFSIDFLKNASHQRPAVKVSWTSVQFRSR